MHELAALRAAWLSAARPTQGGEPSDSLAYWHDRLLAPCLARLHTDHQIRLCTEKHQEPRPGQTTDVDLLEEALLNAAAPADEDVDPNTGEII